MMMDTSVPAAQRICPFSRLADASQERKSPAPDDASSIRTTTPTLSSERSHSTAPTSHEPAEDTRCPVIFTQEVDERLLRTSLEDRIAYLTDFLNFTSHDATIIKKLGPAVNDLIPGLVDDLYAKLFEFDITKKIFMTRNQVGRNLRPMLPKRLTELRIYRALMVPCRKSWKT